GDALHVIPPPRLHSPRLRLRSLCADDAGSISAYRSLAEVARFQSWESFSTDDAARMIAQQNASPPGAAGTWLQLGITKRDSAQLIGDCGIHFLEDEKQVEIGITLSPTEQGRGLAAEAVGCLLGYLFDSLGKHRVIAVTDAENLAAAQLFRRVG